MSLQDPVADMLTRIRNAQQAKKKHVTIPSSKHKVALAGVLQQEGFIGGFEVKDEDTKPALNIELKYHDSKPVIQTLKRVSKPGLRIYKKTSELGMVKDGLGIQIVSTPQGLMTDHQARKNNLGGEVICEVF